MLSGILANVYMQGSGSKSYNPITCNLIAGLFQRRRLKHPTLKTRSFHPFYRLTCKHPGHPKASGNTESKPNTQISKCRASCGEGGSR